MIELLLKKLQVYGELSKRSIEILRKHVFLRKIKPREKFLDIGDYSNEVGFIQSGIFRSYNYQKGEGKTTIQFMVENVFLANLKSFYGNIKSEYALECEMESEIAVITRDSWSIFENEIPEWRNIINYTESQYLLEMHNFQREILNQEALTCYRCFCEKFPTVVHNVSLGHIASYLGITQSTLSRIRKKNFDQ